MSVSTTSTRCGALSISMVTQLIAASSCSNMRFTSYNTFGVPKLENGLAERTYDSFAPKQASAQIKMTGRWPVIFQHDGSRISSRRARVSVRVDQRLATGISAGIALEVIAVDRRGVAPFEEALRLNRVGLHVPRLV